MRCSPSVACVAMSPPPSPDPLLNSQFVVLLDGLLQADFLRVSGIGAALAVVTEREGGDQHARELPGQPSYSPIAITFPVGGVPRTRSVVQGHLQRVAHA